MSNYRRLYTPGGTVFLTIVTYRRQPVMERSENVQRLRHAIARVKHRYPFDFLAGVVLPDHLHFLWSLPPGDIAYSRRIALMKIWFTQSLRGAGDPDVSFSASRRKHREGDIWHRRFWEHTVKEEDDLDPFLHYIHYNPVKHGLVACPHLWPYSSFPRWVRNGLYPPDWGCSCEGREPVLPKMPSLHDLVGE
jgi:putative transposase